jgi:hypothetical protein
MPYHNAKSFRELSQRNINLVDESLDKASIRDHRRRSR